MGTSRPSVPHPSQRREPRKAEAKAARADMARERAAKVALIGTDSVRIAGNGDMGPKIAGQNRKMTEASLDPT